MNNLKFELNQLKQENELSRAKIEEQGQEIYDLAISANKNNAISDKFNKELSET